MTWEDDMVCTCGHTIDAHLDKCLVPDCGCWKSMERIYDREMALLILETRADDPSA